MEPDTFHSLLRLRKKSYRVTLYRRHLSWMEELGSSQRGAGQSFRMPVTEIVCVELGKRDALDQEPQAPTVENQFTGGRRPKELLVFINPFGGRGQAVRIYSRVSPLFQLAGIRTKVIETTRANHARDHILTEDLQGVDGLVCVGGDGMFSELMHGLIGRTQREAMVSEDEEDTVLQPTRIRIGIIPAGSTDCICFATVGINDPVTSALHIIIGDSQPLDVCAVHHRSKLVKYSASLTGYGFYGDVLLESDRHRWMGPFRYNYAGFKTVLSNRSYEGTIEFQTTENIDSNPRDNSRCRTGCLVCSESSGRLKEDADEAEAIQAEQRQIQNSNWHSVEGSFVGINLTGISSACPKSPDGLSPTAHLADGTADLILVKKCSMFQFLRHLTRHTNQKDQFDLPFVEVHRVKALRFTPRSLESNVEQDMARKKSFFGRLCGAQPTQSCWNCDGEALPHVDISVRVHCQLVNLFARGIEGARRASLFRY
ncbi:ceramide kinase-like isoform X2 [Ambystoma mexicanum]|uniref:ceramide kinase-like isoform X2 n=1 Tax=Ambystoma mexicanum TaxID=8296 RepID=UPI0037E90553